jgi:uncharacterized cupin superfamily protein
MPNINRPDFDAERNAPEGFRARRALLARQAGTERLGMSLWELPPGEAAYPYHFHLIDEELIVVLDGQPSIRTQDGWRELEAGEVVPLLAGERGAHQLVNWSEETVRFLSISTSGTPDVVVYPDSGKLGAAERKPDGWRARVPLPESGSVDYWEGEAPPARG